MGVGGLCGMGGVLCIVFYLVLDDVVVEIFVVLGGVFLLDFMYFGSFCLIVFSMYFDNCF